MHVKKVRKLNWTWKYWIKKLRRIFKYNIISDIIGNAWSKSSGLRVIIESLGILNLIPWDFKFPLMNFFLRENYTFLNWTDWFHPLREKSLLFIKPCSFYRVEYSRLRSPGSRWAEYNILRSPGSRWAEWNISWSVHEGCWNSVRRHS